MNSIETVEILEKTRQEKMLKWGIDQESIENNCASIKTVSEEKSNELGKKMAEIIMKKGYNEESEDYDEVLKCIKEGANVDYKNKEKKGFPSLVYCARYGYAKTFITLIKYGANVNVCNDFGTTALMSACVHNYFEMVEMLILRGAYVNARCKDGDTPLICAKKYHSKESFDLLIRANAMIGQKNICNKMCVDYPSDKIDDKIYISKENLDPIHVAAHEDAMSLVEDALLSLKRINTVVDKREPQPKTNTSGFKRIS